ncbi:conserved hypothetical protein [Leishmania major strain Friedlin]|uniref:Uncharacterized protein n=1 Tax=Leishmania major TaxID=5664 RepID=Q4QHX6_LEIMA|nr:conserved hypothetical protein [Leishmania major strain Friedlin]CAG9569663.1 hypothetical_protein_-__conserved [Leishmania major strain Friedlin]CAJ02536.1 conserved hypothetical protein [Leishmania major strain Friedlin]|eukprot:XP_001681222.1 conserved hypothetical protein [Leishmania major strain Friedlin]
MLRGVSLAPQQRAVKDPQDFPSELKNSLLGVPPFPAPTGYGSVGGSGANSAPVSSPLLSREALQVQNLFSREPSPSSLMSRVFRSAKPRYSTGLTGQVPVFDYNGNLTTRQVGVHTFRFRSLSLFYFLRSQPWTVLITYSVILYLIIVLLITAAYYAWGVACGAAMNVVSAIYFTVVSLAANGGYMGEDGDTMTDATHMCYRGRTAIVMVCSYVNILFVGLVAALVVSKAEYTGKLGHRVVFSDFCTLTTVPGRVDRWRLVFRVANVDNHIPLARGKLRLFCVTAEPLKEYHIQQQQQQQLQALRHSRPVKKLAESTWSGIHPLLPGVEYDGGGGGRQPQRTAPPPAEADAKCHTAKATKRHAKAHRRLHSTLAPPAPHDSAESSSREDRSGLTRAQRNRQLHKSGSGGHTDEADRPGRHRGQRSEGSLSPQKRHSMPSAESGGHWGTSSGPSRWASTASSGSDDSTLSTSVASSRFLSASSAAKATSSTRAGRKAVGREKAPSPKSKSSAAVDNVDVDKANSSVSSQEGSCLYAASPLTEVGKEPSVAFAGKRSLLPTGIPEPAVSVPILSHFPNVDAGKTMERVHLCVHEMRWTCAGETYLDRGERGQLSLWYPADIIHIIDERSPLRPFLELPHVAASLGSGGAAANALSGFPSRADLVRQHFQIVAVFDATEMETGSTITAKRTYANEDIVAHYKFSDRLVHVHPESSEVLLDFHYFNALLPMNLVEPSTTESDM